MNIAGIEIVTDPRELANKLSNDELIAFDSETTGLSPWRDKLALLQFYGHDSSTLCVVQVNNGQVPEPIKELLECDRHKFVTHNGAMFDLQFLWQAGVEWTKSRWYDTLIGETVVVGSNRRDVSVSLRESVRRRLGIEIDKDIEHGHWDAGILSDEQWLYAAEDVRSLPALHFAQVDKANETHQMEALEFEMSVMPVFARMTRNGLPLYRDVLDAYLHEQVQAIEPLTLRLHEAFGAINANSHKQVKEGFARNGILMPDTAHDTLVDMILMGGRGGELAELLLDYRKPAQRIKMYSPAWVDEYIIDDLVHARFWQIGTDTSRASSSGPNLQQIPRDGRKIFGSKPGWLMVSADLSQIEVRLAAFIARDEVLLNLLDAEDVHTAIASTIFDVAPENVSREQRKAAKATTFLLLFGGGAEKMYNYARRNGSSMTYDEAHQIVVKFFTKFRGLLRFKNKARELADRGGVCVIKLPNGMKRNLVGPMLTATRIMNTSVQGSAAIGLKHGMRIAGHQGLDQYLGAAVHDELVACVPESDARDYAVALHDAMVEGMREVAPITIKVETKVDTVWQM